MGWKDGYRRSVGWLFDLLVSVCGTLGVAQRGSIVVLAVRFNTVGAVAARVQVIDTDSPLVVGYVSVGFQNSRRCGKGIQWCCGCRR